MSGPEHSNQAAFHQFGQPFGRADAGAEPGAPEVGQGRAPRHDRYLPVDPPIEEVSEASLEGPPPDRTGPLTDLERAASAWEAGLPDPQETQPELGGPKVP